MQVAVALVDPVDALDPVARYGRVKKQEFDTVVRGLFCGETVGENDRLVIGDRTVNRSIRSIAPSTEVLVFSSNLMDSRYISTVYVMFLYSWFPIPIYIESFCPAMISEG